MSFFNTGAIRIVNTDASSVTIKAPETGMSSDYNFTLPPTTGTNNYILKTDGTGATDWVANSSGPPATADASSVMFKDGSDLSGVSTLIYDSANTKLIVLGDVSANTIHTGSVSVATDISSINIYATGDVSGSNVYGNNVIGTSDVSGATMHAGSVTVAGDVSGANITLEGDISSNNVNAESSVTGGNVIGTSDVSGATMHAGSVTVAGDLSANTFNNNEFSFNVDASGNINARDLSVTVGVNANNLNTSILTIVPRVYDNAELDGLSNPKTLDGSANSTIVLNLTAATTYDVSFNSTGFSDGQNINLFYKSTNVNASVAIDFGADGLLSGSGNAQTLTFNSSGQSANLTYLDGISQFAINNVGGSIS